MIEFLVDCLVIFALAMMAILSIMSLFWLAEIIRDMWRGY